MRYFQFFTHFLQFLGQWIICKMRLFCLICDIVLFDIVIPVGLRGMIGVQKYQQLENLL